MARIPVITILTLLLAAGPAEAVRAEAAPRTIDYLAAARRFADCMIRWGRDRYGTEPSPLFAVLLVREAERQARLAHARFMDETCPLPKAFDPPRTTTAAGDPFPDFYFRGARLMHAFALLGEALGER